MAVQDLMDGPQHLVVAQCEEIHRKHTHSEFVTFLAMFLAEGLPAAFYDEWKSDTEGMSKALVSRDNRQRDYRGETADVRKAGDDGEQWVGRVHSKARVLIAQQDPEAEKIALGVQLGEADMGSPTSVRFAIQAINEQLEKPAVVAKLGLKPEDVARGQELWKGIREEQGQSHDAEVGREVRTGTLEQYEARLSYKAEVLVSFRDAVEQAHGVHVPAFDFELLRAAAARRAKRASGEEPQDGNNSGGSGTGGAGFV